MNKAEYTHISQQDADQEGTSMLLSAAVKLKDPQSTRRELPFGLELDPLYAPIIEAAYQLGETIKEQTKHEIESIKRDTADQTRDLYNKLTEAGREFKNVEQELILKTDELNSLYENKLQLEIELENIRRTQEKQQHDLLHQQEIIDSIQAKHDSALAEADNKNETLIEKLKATIEQINNDYEQQVAHLQQQLDYQKQQFTQEITMLREENSANSTELATLRQEKQIWSLNNDGFQEKLQKIEMENQSLQTNFKEKAEKLLRAEHSLKLANEEIDRCQGYIKDLESKNNKMQKELFENWIQKKDEF